MTKAELINEIAIQTGYDKTSIQLIVGSAVENIKKAVAEGDTVYLRGFGSFSTKTRAAKIARDISRETSVEVPEHRIPYFKPSTEFKKEVR